MDSAQLKKEEQKNKWIGYATTIVVHAILLLLLWWAMLHPPDPPIQYGGIELSMALGQPDMGGPNDKPVANPTPVDPTPETVTPIEQVVTQDMEEVGVTAKKVEEKKKIEIKKPEKPIEDPIEKPRIADARALFKKKTSATSEGGSGDGIIPGNEGRQDGVEGGSPDGNGTGNGLGGSGGGSGNTDGFGGFVLAGRALAHKPEVNDNSRETGKVVVGITVDRNGRVTKVQPGLKGTTTLNPTLIEKAKQGAIDARFSPRPEGPEEQFGTMTFVFRFKQ
jgi:outer membrane biosynthesis protein TonB